MVIYNLPSRKCNGIFSFSLFSHHSVLSFLVDRSLCTGHIYSHIQYAGEDLHFANIMFLTYFLCLCQLRDGSTHEGTVTSMEPNEGTFILHSETTKVPY